MQWMAWTAPTAVFFLAIGALLVLMTLWEIWRPSGLRRGWLPFATTRGDRLFVGLLGAAFLNLAWIGLFDVSAWGGFAAGLAWMLAIGRWG